MSDYERQHRYERKKSAAAANIGIIPAIVNPARRAACENDLLLFLTTYFPQSTGLKPFSDDHKRVIQRIQQCALEGGRFVDAVYRGFAKTTISENASIWVALYGHRKYIAIFGSDANAASGNIDSIKQELAENELLYADFPEVCHAIAHLEGKPQRCASQTHTPGNVDGFAGDSEESPQLTHIEWTADTIVLPSIMMPDGYSKASGAIITCRGLTAGSRGMKHKRPDGTQQRPDFVLIDDPQTDESAASPTQVAKRMNVIKKSILRLGGHQKAIAAVMNATVICPEDLVDQLLDAKRNPSWQGERIAMMKKNADAHDKLWLGEYATLRNTYDADTPGAQRVAHQKATEFYRQHRAEMDAGCQISWEHCYDSDNEISAIQHAYNILIDDGEDVFASECQNQPKRETKEENELSSSQIQAKADGLPRGIVPSWANYLTGYIDIQGKALFWMVCAWGDEFRGHIVDYGVFPEQNTTIFTLASLKKSLKMKFHGTGEEGSIRAGLDALADQLAGKEWRREDGQIMRISSIPVDTSWGKHTDLAYEFCRRSPHAAILQPAKGQYVGAASAPFDEYSKRDGEQIGHHWIIAPVKNQKFVRLFRIDTNYWKTFVMNRVRAAKSDPGCLTIFGRPQDHEMLAAHLRAENCIPTESRGRHVDEWKQKPSKPDNHWFDCLVGSAAAASRLGIRLAGVMREHVVKRKLKLSELRCARH